MTKFKTKIVQRFVNGHEYHELLLPDGRCVASGSLSHCWDEREQWEEVLKIMFLSPPPSETQDQPVNTPNAIEAEIK